MYKLKIGLSEFRYLELWIIEYLYLMPHFNNIKYKNHCFPLISTKLGNILYLDKWLIVKVYTNYKVYF